MGIKVGENLNQDQDNSVMVLDDKYYQEWVKLCKGGTRDDMELYLIQMGEKEREKFVNGKFNTQKRIPGWDTLTSAKFDIDSPLAVAAAKESQVGIDVLLENGVDLYAQDSFGHNIFHLMICFSVVRPDQEDDFISMFTALRETLQLDQVRQLLMQENNIGLRPLEFAAQQGSQQFTKAIFSTEGVYVKVVHSGPSGTYKLYDITEYESRTHGSRSDRSPLTFFSYMDFSRLEAFTKTGMTTNFLKMWMRAKSAANIPFFIIWFLARVLQLLGIIGLDFISVSNNGYNSTICQNAFVDMVPAHVSPTDGSVVAMAVMLLIYSMVSIILDVVEVAMFYGTKDRTLYSTWLKGSKTLVIQDHFYRAAHMATNIIIIIELLQLYIVQAQQDPGNVGLDVLRMLQPIVMVWSLVYFLQNFPGVGKFVILMQRSVKTMLLFFVVYIVMIVPFMIGLSLVSSSHASEECVDGFSNFLEALYTMVCLMLNIVHFRDVTYNSLPFALWMLHIFFVFGVAILLLNFLIATMSENVASLGESTSAIIAVQRIAIFVRIEKRLGKVLAKYYDWIKGKFLYVENNRMFLQEIDNSFIGNENN